MGLERLRWLFNLPPLTFFYLAFFFNSYDLVGFLDGGYCWNGCLAFSLLLLFYFFGQGNLPFRWFKQFCLQLV